jgi:hypothetical protein
MADLTVAVGLDQQSARRLQALSRTQLCASDGVCMQALELALLIVSSALSLSLISLGLSAVVRCIGVSPLETLPLGIGVSLGLLALCGSSSPSTLSAWDVLPSALGCAVLLFILHPLYVQWRLRLGGESIALMCSFALMTCWIQVMSICSDSKSINPSIPEFLRAKQSLGVKLIVIVVSLGVCFLAAQLGRHRGRLAALQLSLGDARLLTTFGISSSRYQRSVLAVSIALIVVGSLLYICLQQNFSLQNAYDIVVPAFAISLSQTRVRILTTVTISIVLLTGIELLTRLSAESTIREGHQAALYGAVVVITLVARLARLSGRTDLLRRKCRRRTHVELEVGHG